MFEVGRGIDGQYRVTRVCSDESGMGTLLFVEPTSKEYDWDLVLKYCKEDEGNVAVRLGVTLQTTGVPTRKLTTMKISQDVGFSWTFLRQASNHGEKAD